MNRELERLIYREARLLDEWQLDDWLSLYSEDATYWLPIEETSDPRDAPSIIYETKAILRMRVEQLLRETRPSQTPRSEIVRYITNLNIDAESEGSAKARYNLLAVELRSGDWRQRGLGEKRIFAARCTADVERRDGQWLFVRKRIVLVDRRQPVEGLSFIL